MCWRNICVLFTSIVTCFCVTEIKVGVLLIKEKHAPYTMERVAPALDIAFNKVNEEILNSSYKMVQVKVAYDNICSARYATGLASKMYYEDHIIALVGPACSYALDGVARLAGFWNIPIVTGLGDGGMFKNKTDYPTLTRFSYCQCRMRKVFGSVFKQFNWKDIVVIYDVTDSHTDIMGTTLKEGLQKGGIYPFMIPFYGTQLKNATSILKKASENSRIIVLIVPGELLRLFMLEAFYLGYVDSGEYVFMDVELFEFPGDYWGNHDWRRNDSRDPDAKEAFESLLKVSWQEPSGTAWKNFSCDVIDRAYRDYNYSFGDEKVNFFVGAFHDAVVRLGLAYNETLSLNADLTDGYTVARRMWSKTLPGVTSDVIIDDNGDRDTDFSILDMNPVDGTFKVVANYWGASPGYNAVVNQNIHWAGGRLNPPLNTPVCGFTGDNPICAPPDQVQAYIWTVISVFLVIIITLVVSFFAYRKVQWERDLQKMSWRVNYDDINFKAQDGVTSKTSMARISENQFIETIDPDCFQTVGMYKGRLVSVKRVTKDKIDLNRDVLMELKQVRDINHENLIHFIGACIETGHNFAIFEYCNKGSLQDVLENDNLKLDMMFRLSMLQDVAKGMAFIHKTDLKAHGHLSSANCLVDGKFVVKVTDFGLPTLFDAMRQPDMDNKERLLWVAPEQLRSKGGPLHSQKGDVYSFSIMMEEVLLRSVPFDAYRGVLDVEEIISKVKNSSPPYFRPKVPCTSAPPGYMELMYKCWHEEPDQRPNFEAISKQLKVLQGNKNESLVEALVRRLEEYASNLEDIVAERTKQLIAEKKRSEALLYQILPVSVADQLKQGNPVVPQSYECVTIYFSDIVGFTAMSSESSPLEIVNLLNDLYSMFDSVVDNFDVYKVETIGDAYMVVSGLPITNGEQHAVEICRMSLALLEGVSMFKIRHRPNDTLKLRVGIHSGPCVSGVVGLKMPRYCLFGDTVNTTSRMESNGEALKIHLSHATKDILDRVGNFQTEYRGEIPMKGKGIQVTYWLLGENSVDNSLS